MKNDSPCKDCICFASCVSEDSLLVLLHKCSLLRDVYNYNDGNIGDYDYEKIIIPDLNRVDHNGIRKYLGG